MGNLAGEKYIQQLEPHWDILSQEFKSSLPGKPRLVRHRQTDLMAEYFIVDVPRHSTLLEQAQIYNQRQSSLSGYLVKCISAYHCKELSPPFSSSGHSMDVVTEHIPYRFQIIESLSSTQGTYFFYSMLQGFSELVMHIGQPFQITEDMVGVNKFGIVKVWCNQNFAINALDSSTKYLPSQSLMIDKIVQMITSKFSNKQHWNFELEAQIKNGWRKDFQNKRFIANKHYRRLNIKEVRRNLLDRLQATESETTTRGDNQTPTKSYSRKPIFGNHLNRSSVMVPLAHANHQNQKNKLEGKSIKYIDMNYKKDLSGKEASSKSIGKNNWIQNHNQKIVVTRKLPENSSPIKSPLEMSRRLAHRESQNENHNNSWSQDNFYKKTKNSQENIQQQFSKSTIGPITSQNQTRKSTNFDFPSRVKFSSKNENFIPKTKYPHYQSKFPYYSSMPSSISNLATLNQGIKISYLNDQNPDFISSFNRQSYNFEGNARENHSDQFEISQGIPNQLSHSRSDQEFDLLNKPSTNLRHSQIYDRPIASSKSLMRGSRF